MDREATEGTAQELSAVELKKRMDTLDALATNVLQFFIVIIAATDGPRPARRSISGRPWPGSGSSASPSASARSSSSATTSTAR